MAKEIRRIIEGCNSCPNKDHKGGFAIISYVPTCDAMDQRVIPYDVDTNQRGRISATPKPGFPSWCPLDNYVPK